MMIIKKKISIITMIICVLFTLSNLALSKVLKKNKGKIQIKKNKRIKINIKYNKNIIKIIKKT